MKLFETVDACGMAIVKFNGRTIFVVEPSYDKTRISFILKKKYRGILIPSRRRIEHRLTSAITKAVNVLTMRKIYLIVDSTDCDHSRSVRAIECKNIFDAEKTIDRIYDNAEGPTYIRRVSKTVFLEHEDYSFDDRDYALEAFEDGHPYTIYR